MYIVSHRGGSLENTEHTIKAFIHSIRLPIFGIEVDIQFNEKNEVLLSHEPIINGKQYVKLEELIFLLLKNFKNFLVCCYLLICFQKKFLNKFLHQYS
jgi:glycerophosphoryl diester phosphodiesterase